MNSPRKLGWGMVGDWHFDASFGQYRGLNVFLCFLAILSLFFFFFFLTVRGISLVAASRSDFPVTCVQAGVTGVQQYWGYCCCRTQALEHRLSTCVARA